MGVYPGLLQRLLLAQCPGGEQALAGAAEHVLRQLCHADARLASEPVPGPQPGQQRLSGEYLADDAGRLRDDPAGDGDVNVAGGDGAAERGQPHRLHRHADLGCLGGEHPAQVRRKYGRRRRGDVDADGPGLSAGDPAYGRGGGSNVIEDGFGPGQQLRPGSGQRHTAGGAAEQGRAKFALQPPDQRADRGLAEMKLVGRPK